MHMRVEHKLARMRMQVGHRAGATLELGGDCGFWQGEGSRAGR